MPAPAFALFAPDFPDMVAQTLTRTIMPAKAASPYSILAVVQSGRLAYEAILLVASLKHTNPDFAGKIFVAEPQPGLLWPHDPRIGDPEIYAALQELGATILPFDSKVFGHTYPYGNKIEALAALPDQPFLFLDTDTLITGPLASLQMDFSKPSASMRREGTWPTIELYGPTYAQIWRALYTRFGLDYASSLDLSQPDDYWQRHLYFNAGWFFHKSPQAFGAQFLAIAQSIRDDRPRELLLQEINPWLDQIALPLVIHSFGGGRPGPGLAGLDGDVTCHYRTLSLLYAREADRVVEVLEAVTEPRELRRILRDYAPVKTLVYQNKGKKARALFDRENLPHREQVIRNTLKREGLWLR